MNARILTSSFLTLTVFLVSCASPEQTAQLKQEQQWADQDKANASEDRNNAFIQLIAYQVSIDSGIPPGIFGVFKACGHEASIDNTHYVLGLAPQRRVPMRIWSTKLIGLDGDVTVGYSGGPLAKLTFKTGILIHIEFITSLTAHEQGMVQTSQALQYLQKLKGEGKLPGFSSNEPGGAKLTLGTEPNSPEVYPISRILVFTKNNEADISYQFTCTKANEASDWMLQTASKLDAKGEKILDLLAK